MWKQNYPLFHLASMKQLIRLENSYEKDAICRRRAGYCPGLGLLERNTVFNGEPNGHHGPNRNTGAGPGVGAPRDCRRWVHSQGLSMFMRG